MLIKLLLQFSPFFLDVLSKRHVHLLKNNIKFAIFVFDPFCLHDVRTMFGTMLVNLIETLQNLYFTLIESLLFGLEFIFKALNSIIFSSVNMSTFINMAETTTTYKLFLLEFIPKDSFALG